MEVLKLENVSKFYTSETSVVVGLTGISLSFSTGEFVALTGESGSGKSTLAHVLGGILPYESGELYIYGKPTSHYDAYDWSRYRRDYISFISQSYGILPGNTVSENVESALRLTGLTVKEARKRAADILEEVELTEFKSRKAAKLSSGQKQRLSIARALAKPSRIIIADEPTGNLDRENSEKIIALLKRASLDRLVILITHEFEEAANAATRRIVLSDGAVVTDAKLSENADQASAKTLERLKPASVSKSKKPLSPYVCRLTLKSRPVFSAILCLLLAVTFFISFVFVGNFIIALDDTPTRIYHSSAFFNGSDDRLVVMRSDGEDLTEEDYLNIMSREYVESIERFGAVNDITYHYRLDYDYTVSYKVTAGPDYHETLNPGDYSIEQAINFSDNRFKYARSLPYTNDNIIISGKAAENTYEAVSADPKYKVGDTVKVYIRDRYNWSYGAYLELDLKIVGTTDIGSGLYFSDKLASALSKPQHSFSLYEPYQEGNYKWVFLPYDADRFDITDSSEEEFMLQSGQFLFPQGLSGVSPQGFSVPATDGNRLFLYPVSSLYGITKHKSSLSTLILLSDQDFDSIVPYTSNQISVFIEDYSYAERVMASLTDDGYIAISPYKIGSTEVDEKLKNERLITLAVCAATFIIAFALQFILLRSMFASLFEYYRLMSNTGLTAGVAFSAVTLMLLITTFIGEALGAASIYILNAAEVMRIVNIFKYLDPPLIALLFVLHLITVAFSLWGIIRGLKKNVFGKGKKNYDMDFTLMEEHDDDQG